MFGAKLTVFYDGGCPLCKREIGFYQRQRGAELIQWLNIADNNPEPVDELLPQGLSRCQAMARFHVMDSSGVLLSGGDAFVEVWRLLPRFRLLAVVFSLPVMRGCVNWGYEVLLRMRPAMQKGVFWVFGE
jgi:predicted DCC family thiol-disulfide oxidoreductase YuxK